MNFNIPHYLKTLEEANVSVMYSGPIWTSGINNLAEMLQHRLEIDALPLSASQAVFSVFVEQMNNMLQYSTEKETFEQQNGVCIDTSKGIFILGMKDKKYFIYTGNLVSNYSMKILTERIDYLNSLDKKEMRKYFKERVNADNDNPESKGAGLGLIEIARRASSKIVYEFEPRENEMQYFTMYVEI